MKPFAAVIHTLEKAQASLSAKSDILDQNILDEFDAMGDLAQELLARQARNHDSSDEFRIQPWLQSKLDSFDGVIDCKRRAAYDLRKSAAAIEGLLTTELPVLAAVYLGCTPVTGMTRQ